MKRKLDGLQARAARSMLGLSQQEMADRIGVRRRVLLDFEAGRAMPHEAHVSRLQDELTALGICFIETEDKAIGVLMSADAADRARLRRHGSST